MIATVMFYNFILFSSTFFVWLSEKGKGNIEKYLFLFLAFLIVFIPAAIRYDVGIDYLSYLSIYNDSKFDVYKFKEPSFYFINYFLSNMNAHVQWLFVICALIFTFVAFKAYPEKNVWLFHFLFFATLFYFSLTGIRQAISIAFGCFAIFYFFQKRYVLFFTLIIIGATFHQSMLLIAILGFVALIPLSYRMKTHVAPIFFVGIILFTFFAMNIVIEYIEQFLKFMGFAKYANYFNSRFFIPYDSFGSGLGMLAKFMFSIYIILNTKQFIQVNKNYWLLIILIFLYAISLVLANKIFIFGRMTNIFVVSSVIGAFLLLELPKNRQVHRVVLIFFIVFLSIAYIKDGLGLERNGENPKLNPYQTIFKEL